MALWIAKAIVQKVISFFPQKHKVNYFFQKNVTKGLDLTDTLFVTKLQHCNQHVDAYRSKHIENKTFTSLELGTGWFPIVPVGLYLCNASEIYSIDIESLLEEDKTKLTIIKFIEAHESGRLKTLLPFYDPSKMHQLYQIMEKDMDQKEINDILHFTVIIGDIINTKFLAGKKFDLIHSNNTFEHIPPKVLQKILLRFKDVLKTDGTMSHFIDMSDHFSHFDKNISSFNFLRFSDRQWKFIDNSIQPQNRLRISDYKNIYKKTGWQIRKEILTQGNSTDLKNLKLAPEFKGMNLNDLLITHALFISY